MTNSPDSRLSDFQHARRLTLGAILALAGCVLLFGDSMHGELFHERIESSGIMLILIGIGGRMWSTLYIGGRKSAELVQLGPYSIMRNPLYFFSAVAAAGVGAQIGSITATIVFAIACWAAFTIVIKREESYLSEKLGQPYRDYLARVPRFFPNPFLYRDEPVMEFEPRLLNRTLLDGLVFLAAVPLFETIEELHEMAILPTWFVLY